MALQAASALDAAQPGFLVHRSPLRCELPASCPGSWARREVSVERVCFTALGAQAAQDQTRETRVAGRSTTSLGSELRADIECPIRPYIGIGALVRFDAALDWKESRAIFFAPYRFD